LITAPRPWLAANPAVPKSQAIADGDRAANPISSAALTAKAKGGRLLCRPKIFESKVFE
jgi:hypothetical protein